MNTLQQLLAASPTEKDARGITATPAEIAQQPELWRDTARRFVEVAPDISELFQHIGLPHTSAEVVFAGAGTSDFVGRCLQGPVSAALATRALAIPTTDIVTHPAYAFPADRPGLMVSCARSGNSPESAAAMDLVLAERPAVRHLVITCNQEGALARRAAELGARAVTLALDPRTDDRGLAMTSSFSSMVVAGLGLAYLGRAEEYLNVVARMTTAAETLLAAMPDVAARLIAQGPTRACFLGSGAAYGAAVESHLKLQELTDGDLLCFCDTFLGIRHGPRAAIRDKTLVTCFLASNPEVRRYELDLIRANREQGIGLAHLIVADRRDGLTGLAGEVVAFDPEDRLTLPDEVTAPIYVITGQLLGLFASLARGLKPDAPSAGGAIHRVVQGVTIYPKAHTS